MPKRHFLHHVVLASLPCLVSVGYVLSTVNYIIGDPPQEKIPPNQLADYFATDCTGIWPLSGQSTETNPLYWLRVMDCANRLMPVQARSEASTPMADTWQDAFRRGVLLGNANITLPERREVVTRLDALSSQIPPQVHPLHQVRRSSQTLQLQLAEERTRYSKFQWAPDSDLNMLRQQQQHLRPQLDLTTRKLENLTDIERQFSTRKPGGNYNSDALHRNDKLTTPNNEEGAAPSVDEVMS